MAPLWEEMSTGRKVVEAVGLPILWGVLCGLAAGVSGGLYLVGVIIGILGGVAGGMQYRDRNSALVRGIVAGTLFGLAILLGIEISGSDPKADLPDPRILLLVLTIVPSIPLHWLGWRIRARQSTA